MTYKAESDLKFEEVFGRVCEKTEIKSSIMLAQALGISGPSVSRQKVSNTFPAAWLIIIAAKYGLDLNYLAFGKSSPMSSIEAVEADLVKAALRYVKSKHHGFSEDHSTPEANIILGEVMALLDRLSRHLKK